MDHKPNWMQFAAHRSFDSNINSLDDGCLMHIFSFLSPIPDRYNTALVCQRWLFLACHPRLWLRVDRTAVVNNGLSDQSSSRVFPNIEAAVSSARPGDTILIGAGGSHYASNIQINKPLCLIGGGEVPDDTTLVCSRGSDSALEFLSTCKLANLTVKAELGCCLLHRSGRLIIEDCVLQCESNPLDYLSYAIVTTAGGGSEESDNNSVSVSQTRILGGAKAVLTSGTLALQQVRVMYAKSSVVFWFNVDQWRNVHLDGKHGTYVKKDYRVKAMVASNELYAGSMKKRDGRLPPKRGQVKLHIFCSIFKFIQAMAFGKQRTKVMAEEKLLKTCMNF